MTLDQLTLGQTCVITGLTASKSKRRRMMDMGLTIGTAVLYVRRAPMGDPIELKVRGYHVSLRSNDAKDIVISNISDE